MPESSSDIFSAFFVVKTSTCNECRSKDRSNERLTLNFNVYEINIHSNQNINNGIPEFQNSNLMKVNLIKENESLAIPSKEEIKRSVYSNESETNETKSKTKEMNSSLINKINIKEDQNVNKNSRIQVPEKIEQKVYQINHILPYLNITNDKTNNILFAHNEDLEKKILGEKIATMRIVSEKAFKLQNDEIKKYSVENIKLKIENEEKSKKIKSDKNKIEHYEIRLKFVKSFLKEHGLQEVFLNEFKQHEKKLEENKKI